MTTTSEFSYAQLMGKVMCPSCDNTRIRRASSTSELVDLRCEQCGLTWQIAERRRPRTSATALDGAEG